MTAAVYPKSSGLNPGLSGIPTTETEKADEVRETRIDLSRKDPKLVKKLDFWALLGYKDINKASDNEETRNEK